MKICKVKPDRSTCSACLDIQEMCNIVDDCSKCKSNTDTYELLQAFDKVKPSNGKNSNGQPYIIIADTIKGKGVSFIENHREWHHHALTYEQYELAKSEIENA